MGRQLRVPLAEVGRLLGRGRSERPQMKPPSDKLAAKNEQLAPEISEFCRLLAKVLRRSCQATEPTSDGASSQGDRVTEPYPAPQVSEPAKRPRP